MKYRSALAIFALLAMAEPALAQTFQTTVSQYYVVPGVVNLNFANSTMQIHWFVDQSGGRTVYSDDVVVGALTHGVPPNISAHATWVINYNAATHTVNLVPRATHITNWWGAQRCHVYEDGACNCDANPNWAICGYPPMAAYVQTLSALAAAASINARLALEAAGYHVTRN